MFDGYAARRPFWRYDQDAPDEKLFEGGQTTRGDTICRRLRDWPRLERGLSEPHCRSDVEAKHRRAAGSRKDQRLHRRLSFRRIVLGLRKLRDVVAGVFKRDELATTGERDWNAKWSLPAAIDRHGARPSRMGIRVVRTASGSTAVMDQEDPAVSAAIGMRLSPSHHLVPAACNSGK